MIAKALKEDVKKTRWGFIGRLALGMLAGIALLMWFLIFLMQSQHPPVQQAAATTPEVHYFDYAKIVGVIGSGYLVREKSGDDELWSNSIIMVRLIGAPSKVSRVILLFPEHAKEDVMVMNLLTIRELNKVLTGDELILDWMVDSIELEVREGSKISNNTRVNFQELSLGGNKGVLLTFTPI